MPNPPPLTIDSGYLTKVQTELQDLLDKVNGQLIGDGTKVVRGNTVDIPPVDANLNLNLRPGGPASGHFDIGEALSGELAKMGGSVNDELTWLKKVLTAMISEITNTIAQFGQNETLNAESADQLFSEFSATIQNINNPPGSSSSSSSGH